MKKIINYLPFFVLLLLPLSLYPGVDASGWRSSSDVHALLEFASSLLAITAGVMVLLHFFTTGRWFFLIISIGFVLIGTEEFIHAIFSFNRIWSEIPPTFKLAISTTWLTGQFALVTSFFIALLFGEREIVPAKRVQNAVVYNIIGLICAVFVALLIFNSQVLPNFVQLGSITKKLIELSLALLYFTAFLFYSNIYLKQQSRSLLLWSIIACIIFRVLVHIFVFDTQAFYDSHWDTAHLIVFLSYFFPIFGVWGETIKLHRSAQAQLIELEEETTERKRAEETLQQAHDRLRRFIDANIVGVVIASPSGGIIETNDYYLRSIGYTREEFEQGMVDWRSITPPEWLPADEHAIEELRERGACTPYEKEYIRRDGTRVSVFLSDAMLPGPEKQIAVFVLDITERKHAEEEVQSLARFPSENPNPVLRLGRDGTILYANSASRLLLQDWGCAAGERAPLFWQQEISETLASQTNKAIDIACGDITFSFLVVPILEADYVNLYGRDITERKRAEEELVKYRDHLEDLVKERTKGLNEAQEALVSIVEDVNEKSRELAQANVRITELDRLKSAFLATMSHELRTPLNSIIGFTGIVLQGMSGPLNEEQAKQLAMVKGSANHLLDLINDVLDISKIEAGQVQITRKSFDMRSVIEAALRTVLPLAAKKGLSLDSVIASDVGVIISDRRRVEQILINLVNNAVKFTEQGNVRIECRINEGWLETSVHDTGIGIKAEDVGKLFIPFSQIDTGLARNHEGTGLGLSICGKLLQMLGGTIRVESEWGKGSKFTFTLPLS